jgi:hypothetical protein
MPQIINYIKQRSFFFGLIFGCIFPFLTAVFMNIFGWITEDILVGLGQISGFFIAITPIYWFIYGSKDK